MVTREFPSKSSAAVYTAAFDPSTGEGSCTCPAWRFKKPGQDRTCGHVKTLRAETTAPATAPTTPALTAGQKAAATRRARLAAQASGLTICGKCEREWPTDSGRQVCDTCGNDGEVEGHAVRKDSTRVNPMLASAMTDGATLSTFMTGAWVLEEKYDGHRVLIRVTPGAPVEAWSRPRAGSEPLTRTLPAHLDAAAAQLPAGVYDGEIIVPGGTAPDVARLENRAKLRLVLFDVVEVLGERVTDCPYRERRELLARAVQHHEELSDAPVISIPAVEAVHPSAVQRIWARGGEGAIVKRLTSTYRPGWRSPDWVKVKRQASDALTIIGFEAGKCGPYSVVKLRADDGRETTVKAKDNATLAALAANPASFVGRRLVVSYIERTNKGNYRHATWDHLLEVQ